MRALVVRQPYAAQIARGEKTIEVRTWHTQYRGRMLIYAGRTADPGGANLPRGVTVCAATLIDCRPFTRDDTGAAMSRYRRGRYAWVLRDISPLPNIPVRGQLGLFTPPPHLLAALEKAAPVKTENQPATAPNRPGTSRAKTPTRD